MDRAGQDEHKILSTDTQVTTCIEDGDMTNSFENQIDNVGKGWHPLCKILDTAIKDQYPNYEIAQIKEKFGGLRFYYTLPDSARDEQVEALVRSAETLSYIICEECGEPGKLRNLGHWRLTRCDTHYESAKAARKENWVRDT